jgi:hypothetical protein
MKHITIALAFLGISVLIITGAVFYQQNRPPEVLSESTEQPKEIYWFLLHRESNIEYLYFGLPNQPERSKLIKTFTVKTGRPGERPTPLPELAGREYWLVTAKTPVEDNPETSPYFITLDVPAPSEPPYGPSPYLECNGQCDWVTYGEFGLHGVNGDLDRLSTEDPGSSGCIRHTDEDITFLYNLLEPETEEIRYYIKAI